MKRSRRGSVSRRSRCLSSSRRSRQGPRRRAATRSLTRRAIAIAPGTEETNSPAGATVTVAVPHIQQPTGQDDSTTREATVTLPPGMGINPSAAAAPNNLEDLRQQSVRRPLDRPDHLPGQSRIGTATITSAALPEGSSKAPYISASSRARTGFRRRVPDLHRRQVRSLRDRRAAARPRRRRSDHRADDHEGHRNPPGAVHQLQARIRRRRAAVLSSPGACGPNSGGARMTPWSGNPPRRRGLSFTLHGTPGGGACAANLAARPFAPSFAAAPKSSKAGAYSPLKHHDRPRQRPAGAEGGDGRAGTRDDRQTGRASRTARRVR